MKIYTSTGNRSSASCFPACCSNLLAIRIVNDMLLKFYTTFFTLHMAMHIGNWFWLHVYWSWLPGRICIYFTNIYVISSKLYCLQNFVWTNQTIINFNEGSVPEMRIWPILLIKSDLKWCIYLSRSLFPYIIQIKKYVSQKVRSWYPARSQETWNVHLSIKIFLLLPISIWKNPTRFKFAWYQSIFRGSLFTNQACRSQHFQCFNYLRLDFNHLPALIFSSI